MARCGGRFPLRFALVAAVEKKGCVTRPGLGPRDFRVFVQSTQAACDDEQTRKDGIVCPGVATELMLVMIVMLEEREGENVPVTAVSMCRCQVVLFRRH